VKKPREKRLIDSATTPIPNYGRGAFFGMAAMLLSAFAWAVLIEVSGEFNIGLMLFVGWLIGAAVRWGMGTVDRVGLGITLYGTLVSILIGTYLYLGARIHDHGGTVTVEGITGAFRAALHDLKFLALFGGFTVAACWLGVAVCKEGMPVPLNPKVGKKGAEQQAPPPKR
jgi:hypothetical protein